MPGDHQRVGPVPGEVPGGPLSTLALALAVLVAGARSIRRIEVAGASMSPALEPGDRLLVIGTVWSRSSGPARGTSSPCAIPATPDAPW